MTGVPKIMLQRLQTLGAKVVSQSDDVIRFITTKGDDITLSYQQSFKGKMLPTWKKRRVGEMLSYSHLFREILDNNQRRTVVRKLLDDGSELRVESLFKYFDDISANSGKLQEWVSSGVINRKISTPYLSNYKHKAQGLFLPTKEGLEHRYAIWHNIASNVKEGSSFFDF